MVARARQLVATIALAVGCGVPPDATTRTTVLPPAAGGEAFEPTVAIDPAHPEQILVAAMYGVPFARGGTGIWVWRSADGGDSWSDARLAPPGPGGVDVTPVSAADVVAGFAEDGTGLLASMAGTSSSGPPSKGTFLSRLDAGATPTPSVLVYHNSIDSAAGRQVIYDKPWLVVDHRNDSAHRGTVYLSVGAITAGLGAAGIGVDWTPLGSQLLLAVSRDGGRSFSPSVVVADSAFSGYLTVGGAGTLDITHMRLKNRDGAGDAVYHRRSMDGGRSLEPPVTVATMKGDTLLELPVVAAKPDGDLLACWSQGVRTSECTNQVRCATRKSGAAWTTPRGVDAAFPPDVVPAWPAVVGTERGWYLLRYLVGRARTEVALFRSADGDTFTKVATFSAAAYVLPRTNGAAGGAAVYVTILSEPP